MSFLSIKITWFHPLIVHRIYYPFLPEVLSVLEPVPLHYAAAMVSVTAEAALIFLWEDNVPL